MSGMRLNTKKLDEIIAKEPGRAAGIVKRFSFKIEAGAKMNAPVDTGALKSSIKAEENGGPLHWWVHDGVHYGIYQELGTRFMAAQAFMRPAVESVRKAWTDAWKELCK
jgi:HK97 gp10 family phage protein